MQIVSSETERLESTVGDLLDLARLEGGGIALHRETVPVAMAVRSRRRAPRRGIAGPRVELARDIAPDAKDVDGDARRLEQVLQNLVANASRHTPKGGRIALSSRLADGRVVVAVTDTGTGITAEHLPFVFDRFYKADAARAQEGAPGSGLGLSIVKAIVEAHGGRVTALEPTGRRLPGSTSC